MRVGVRVRARSGYRVTARARARVGVGARVSTQRGLSRATLASSAASSATCRLDLS